MTSEVEILDIEQELDPRLRGDDGGRGDDDARRQVPTQEPGFHSPARSGAEHQDEVGALLQCGAYRQCLATSVCECVWVKGVPLPAASIATNGTLPASRWLRAGTTK